MLTDSDGNLRYSTGNRKTDRCLADRCHAADRAYGRLDRAAGDRCGPVGRPAGGGGRQHTAAGPADDNDGDSDGGPAANPAAPGTECPVSH